MRVQGVRGGGESVGDAMQVPLSLVEAAVSAGDPQRFVEAIAAPLASLSGSLWAFAYVADPRMSASAFAPFSLSDDRSEGLARRCPDWLDAAAEAYEAGRRQLVVEADEPEVIVYTLPFDGRVIGIVGVPRFGQEFPGAGWSRLLETLGTIADRLAERESAARKLHHLNTYLTVSSMLAKSVDLAELLEIALYCCMDVVAAEAASILLLDEAKESFRFYRVEGSAKPLLCDTTFPATEGVAGRVLETLEAEIVHDVEHDPRFYDQIDLKTGYHTRNLIAVPLVAGEERVGVLEVLNRSDGGPFTPDERLILVSVADEIAFAVRNATVFDYVVNTYCKRRQGQNSCKGCERPLGSWTPCMRYREFLP